MPRGNKRGPDGEGPMTGRALGYCAGNEQPGFTADAVPQGAGRGLRNGAGLGPGFGRGFDRGRGMNGRFFLAARGRGAYYAPAAADEVENFDSPENEDRKITRLENLANTLTNELDIVKKQIDRLKND
jgi:hypothetical protein